MAGTTITLKNVPPDLHRLLTESAKRHKRSLNQEAIHFLEEAVSREKRAAFSLSQPPAPRSAGIIRVSVEKLNSRADDLLERGA